MVGQMDLRLAALMDALMAACWAASRVVLKDATLVAQTDESLDNVMVVQRAAR